MLNGLMQERVMRRTRSDKVVQRGGVLAQGTVRRTWLLYAVIALMAISCGKEASECTRGDPCICQGGGSCEMGCEAGGCDFVTSGASDAELTCAGGGCCLKASGSGAVEFRCNGGNCVVEHAGGGSITLDCEGGGCSLTRTGPGVVRSEE